MELDNAFLVLRGMTNFIIFIIFYLRILSLKISFAALLCNQFFRKFSDYYFINTVEAAILAIVTR